MNEPIVVVDNLIKRYSRITAVDQVSFTVEKGEIFGLLGPNGAGKTSTLECIEGIRSFDDGTISVAGMDVRKDRQSVRKLLGVQLQASSLPGNIRAHEAMSLICSWNGLPVRTDLLGKFNMDREPKKQYSQMSTGQKRRLHLALSLAADPSVVILDEPTAGLDVEGRSQLHRTIRDLSEKGMTFILATHDMAEAETMCDHIAILIEGKIAALGTPDQVTAAGSQETKIRIQTRKKSLLDGRNEGIARYVGEKEGYGVWMTTDISRTVSHLLKRIEDSNDIVLDMRVERPSLEERFLEIVGTEAWQ